MPNVKRPVAMGMVGLGGYAGSMCDFMLRHMDGADPVATLAAVFEPDHTRFEAKLAELRRRGLQTLHSYDALLQSHIEAVWLPLPIHLHRSFTEQALGAGKAVLCEKPAAGSIDDVRAMLAARDSAKLPVAIGFQHMYSRATHQIKQRLLDGAIGQVTSATLIACWPRGSNYYSRSSWAGCLRRDGVWVMDSPAMNALSHYIHLLLFWLGETPLDNALPASVEAELYRANPIENFDTCSIRWRMGSGRVGLALLTHACARQIDPLVTISGTLGSMNVSPTGGATLSDSAGRTIEQIQYEKDLHETMLRQFVKMVRGESADQHVATLEQSAAHLIGLNGASEASAVVNVPQRYLRRVARERDDVVVAISGVEEAFEACAHHGHLLHECGNAAWSVPAGAKDLRGYSHFAGPKT